jgi:hypothetical protein
MKRVIAMFAITAMLGLTGAPPARADAPVTLTVRLYNAAGVTAADLLTARYAAALLLRDAGVDVVFRQCGQPSASLPTAPCEEPLRTSEVVVRLINAPLASATLHPDAFGVAYVVRATNRGWLATVFADRTSAAAARAGVDAGTLLGRLMAHELAHLLLGIDYHGDTGVMRAEWPDAALTRAAGEWRFTADEAVRMQRVIAAAL